MAVIDDMADDETETVSFHVVGVERVFGRGDLKALAIVELTLHGIAVTLQGIQVRHVGDRITVTLPTFKHPRDGIMRTAVIFPPELCDAIGASVANAYDTLGTPTLPLDPSRGVTGSARF